MSPVPVWAATGLLPVDCELLLRLLELPTAGPLQTGPGGPVPQLARAEQRYAAAAARLGLATVHFGPALPEELDRPDVPAAVRRAVAERPGFLECQPGLVLRLGPPRPASRTVMFNVRLDTVAGSEPASFDGRRFRGAGALGAKGPAVALLAGVRAALAVEPALVERVTVLVQVVAGTEGGALGTFGTRPLVERGHVGALNVFCRPTGLRWLPRAAATAEARLRVCGEDAPEGRPGAGHHATVLLGFLAQHLARALADRAVGVGGLSSGPRPGPGSDSGPSSGPRPALGSGSGELLLRLPYRDTAEGRRAERAVETAVGEGLARFSAGFADLPDLARTAEACTRITALDWPQRGLPALDSRHPALERLLTREVGLTRWPDGEPAPGGDAIWAAGLTDALTVLLGPGDPFAEPDGPDGAVADVDRLDAFADAVARLLTAFARSV